MKGKRFCPTDAKTIIERVIASVGAGFEREALLILAAEAMREAAEWLQSASAESFRFNDALKPASPAYLRAAAVQSAKPKSFATPLF